MSDIIKTNGIYSPSLERNIECAQTAETEIIGILLHSPSKTAFVYDLLQPKDFGVDYSRWIYATMKKLHENGDIPTPFNINRHLPDGQNGKVLKSWVLVATQSQSPPCSAINFVNTIKSLARERAILQVQENAKKRIASGEIIDLVYAETSAEMVRIVAEHLKVNDKATPIFDGAVKLYESIHTCWRN